MNDLDTLLSEPLGEIADDGFSSRVVARIANEHVRRARLEALLLLATVAVALAILPFTTFGHAMADALVKGADSAPIAAALAVLVLTAILAREIQEWQR